MALTSISLNAARAQGFKRYYTGIPCKHGHVAERLVSNKTCMQCVKNKANARYAADPSKVKRRAIDWARANPERNRERVRVWQAENPERVAEWRRIRKVDPVWRCATVMRRILAKVLLITKERKDAGTFVKLGYGPDEFRKHIEMQFRGKMTWDNHGKWHVDHIIPVIAMIEGGERDPSVINSLTNLRPIWAKENLRKGSRRESLL